MKILLVETDESAIQSLKPLIRLGHKILVCKNGRNGLTVLEQQDFDLLMVDVELAEIGGIDLIIALRRKEKATGKHTPVVALGSLPGSGRIPGMDAGFDHELRKPIQQQLILEFLDKLSGVPAKVPVSVPPTVAPDMDPPQKPPEDTAEDIKEITQKPPVNEKAGLSLCDSDEELFHEILEIFLTDASTRLENLKTAVNGKNAELIQKQAHALKGASGNICAEPFKEIVARIERAAKNNDLNDTPLLFADLTNEYKRLTAFIEKILLSKKQ